jgi:aminomethyltransferase
MVPVGSEFSAFLAGRCADTIALAPGIETPRCFSDAAGEHLATRRAAGLFDFSFMYCAEITGSGGGDFLAALQTRAVDTLPCGRIAYTLLLRDDGSVLIDATVWRLARDRYWLFTGRRGDANYIADFARTYDVALTNRSPLQSVLAVQGPASAAIIERTLGTTDVCALPYFGFTQLAFAGAECQVARIGYSGELGFEIVIADAVAPALWSALVETGIDYGLREGGFAAIDSLRIEAGHLLFTRELAARAAPAELGLTRLIDFYRQEFCGATAVRARRWRRPARRLVGLLPLHGARFAPQTTTARMHATCTLTSKAWSPLMERELGLGFVATGDAYPGTTVTLDSGERAKVARLPFYDPARRLPRRAP